MPAKRIVSTDTEMRVRENSALLSMPTALYTLAVANDISVIPNQSWTSIPQFCSNLSVNNSYNDNTT